MPLACWARTWCTAWRVDLSQTACAACEAASAYGLQGVAGLKFGGLAADPRRELIFAPSARSGTTLEFDGHNRSRDQLLKQFG